MALGIDWLEGEYAITTTIERAYELARSGKFSSIGKIGETLSREGYEGGAAHLSGLGLKRDLQRLMREARDRP